MQAKRESLSKKMTHDIVNKEKIAYRKVKVKANILLIYNKEKIAYSKVKVKVNFKQI